MLDKAINTVIMPFGIKLKRTGRYILSHKNSFLVWLSEYICTEEDVILYDSKLLLCDRFCFKLLQQEVVYNYWYKHMAIKNVIVNLWCICMLSKGP